jgi:hypothetical protein
MKKTILVDFDGVIHRYSKGWHDGTAYDEPMEGAFEALKGLEKDWRVVIFSTRESGQIATWLGEKGYPNPLEITNVKLPATAIIDDRAIRFENWDQALSDFKHHYEDGKPMPAPLPEMPGASKPHMLQMRGNDS